MNERIKELANQARQYAFGQIENPQDPTEWSKGHDMFEEKFAELIVKECAAIVWNDKDSQRMLKHFGVEL